MRFAIAALAASVTLSAARARAGETTLAEPIIEENITDADATDVGTLEIDLTGAALRSPSSGLWRSAVEAEWRPIDRLGVGAEIGTSGVLDGTSPHGPDAYEPRGAVSWVVGRDAPRNLYLQAEIAARWSDASGGFVDPTESALPYTFGLRSATRAGPFTLRAAAVGEAGGASAHVPVRASGAALGEVIALGTRFYLGAEAIADWARARPFLVVPEALLLRRIGRLPLRFGVGVPFTVGARGEQSSYGIAFRIVLEPSE